MEDIVIQGFDVDRVIETLVKKTFIDFCNKKVEQGYRFSQEDFDLLHDFRDTVIRDFNRKVKET